MPQEWTRQRFLEHLADLRTWRRGETRAPHKPLLILLALARFQQAPHNRLSFLEIEGELGDLLHQFGPPRRRNSPAYPFWRLQKDDIWEVTADGAIDIPLGGDPRVTDLRAGRATGSFPPGIRELLGADTRLVGDAASLLLRDHFAESLHEDILANIGLSVESLQTGVKRKRSPTFVRDVLQAYEFRCAVCGFDGKLTNKVVALEAAHVKWFAFGGPDSVNNGLALCSLHHKAFDIGAIGISPQMSILVSQAFHGGARWEETFGRYIGKRLMGPQSGQEEISFEFQTWHSQEVFKAPARRPIK